MSVTKFIEFNVLSDKETLVDELGSHQNIADTLAYLINNTDDGKSIALTGSWGSGKSSVIKMLEKRLLDISNDYRVFTFDTWSHENDPLRRQFLESLRDKLLPNNWLRPNDFHDDFEELSKRKETVKVRYRSNTTCFGIFFAIFMLLMPIGLVVLSNKELYKNNDYIFCLGIVLISLPFLLILSNVFWHFIVKIYKYFKDEESISLKSRFSVLSGSSIQNYKSDNYKTPDPTTIEFQNIYKKVLNKTLKGNKRKLIIVIDNLDRIDEKHALNMWSNLKTFIEPTLMNNEGWAKRLWLIVPFDPINIHFWDNDDVVLNSFMDKTFQLQYKVSPPILSNWVEYFKKQLSKALPHLSRDEIHEVNIIFSEKMQGLYSIYTPRSIKLYINRLGALCQHWKGKIDIKTIALYVALETTGNFDIDKLLSNVKELLNPIEENFFNKNYPDSLAALFYNIPESEALQVLLEPKIEKAIKENNIENFNKLQELYGFNKVLEGFVRKRDRDWIELNPLAILLIANEIDFVSTSEDHSLKRIWYRLVELAKKVPNWKYLDEFKGSGISKLIEFDKSNEFSNSILRSISRSDPTPKNDDEEIISSEVANDWLDGTLLVLGKIFETHGQDFITETYKCPGSALTYLELMKIASSRKDIDSYLSYFEPKTKQEEISRLVATHIESGNYSQILEKTFFNLIKIKGDWSIEKIIEFIFNRINSRDVTEPLELYYLLNSLIKLSNDLDVKKIKELTMNGDCIHYMFNLEEDAEYHHQATSICYFLMLLYNTSADDSLFVSIADEELSDYESFIESPESYSHIIEEICSNYIDKSNIQTIIENLDNDANKALYQKILSILTAKVDIIKIIDPLYLLEIEDKIYFSLTIDEYMVLISKYVEKGSLLKHLIENHFDKNLASVYWAIFESCDVSISEEFTNWIIKGLLSINQHGWIDSIEASYKNLFDLVLVVKSKGVDIKLGTSFEESLKFYLNERKNGNINVPLISSNWSVLVQSIEDDLKLTFIDSIIDEIILGNKNFRVLISLFDINLLTCKRLEIKKDDIIQKGIIPLLEKKNQRLFKFNWYLEVLSNCQNIILKCKKEYRNTLKEKIKSKLSQENLSASHRIVIIKLADLLKVKIPNKSSMDTD